MAEVQDDLIFDIRNIFKDKNQEENSVATNNQKRPTINKSEKIETNSFVVSTNKDQPEENEDENISKVTIITYLIFFFIEIGFSVFMLYNLYYVFNRPSREIDLNSNKYNNTLSFLTMSSNLGTINGTTLEMFHDINIGENTKFIHLSKIAYFYPDGTIINDSFRINSLYTNKIIFMDTNILGRGDFRESVNFNNVDISPLNEFDAVEITVGPIRITSNGAEFIDNNTKIDIDDKCNNSISGLQLLDAGDFNSGEIIGQHNRKLVILKNDKVLLRSNDKDDMTMFDFEGEEYNKIEFFDFIAHNNEIGVILKKQNGNMRIIKSGKSINLPNDIVVASIFQNKSMLYCTGDCNEIRFLRNIDKPEKSIILFNNPSRNKFMSGRLYGGKIVIISPDIIVNDHDQNIFTLKFNNPIDISTFGKMAIITDYEVSENKYNFYIFQKNHTKKIFTIQANTAKASFIHFNTIIIAYSSPEKGTFYVSYDVFNDQISSEFNINENSYDSFYISHELLSLFGNNKNSDFTLLESFAI